jgi:methionyl-tRNA formyltransferase
MKEIRALVLCSGRFAIPSVHQLLHAGMLTAIAVPAAADEIAEQCGEMLKGTAIPVLRVSPAGYEQELIKIIQKYKINTGLVLTFSHRLPASVYSLPALGFYNFHPGPLPLYRGPDPVFQQIKRMEAYAGIVIHTLDEHFDTGPVFIKEKIKIAPGDTYGLLTTKLAAKAADMLGVLIKMLMLEINPPLKPQHAEESTYYKKHGAADVMINWNKMSAEEIVALMNACNPWNKGALTRIKNRIVRLPEGKVVPMPENNAAKAGDIVSIADNELIIAALGNMAVSAPFLHLEEGFFNAGRLPEFGIRAGDCFEN